MDAISYLKEDRQILLERVRRRHQGLHFAINSNELEAAKVLASGLADDLKLMSALASMIADIEAI